MSCSRGCQLGVAGVFQFFGVSIKQQAPHVATGNGARFVDEFPTLVTSPRATHARALRALSGEQEREQRIDLPVGAVSLCSGYETRDCTISVGSSLTEHCPSGEMADATDSKSVAW